MTERTLEERLAVYGLDPDSVDLESVEVSEGESLNADETANIESVKASGLEDIKNIMGVRSAIDFDVPHLAPEVSHIPSVEAIEERKHSTEPIENDPREGVQTQVRSYITGTGSLSPALKQSLEKIINSQKNILEMPLHDDLIINRNSTYYAPAILP